jgi:hypothetical protein
LALPSTTTTHQSKKIMPTIQEETPIATRDHKKEMVHVVIQDEDSIPIQDHENKLDSCSDNQTTTTNTSWVLQLVNKTTIVSFITIVTTSSC